MTHAAMLIFSLAGFAALLLAMARHQQDWLRRKLPPATSRRLRAAGLALQVLAFATAGLGLGWADGAVVWFGWMTVAAATVVTVNLNRARIRGGKG
ncbi:MAG: DUF3325 domain-containing protein [Sphingobium sp.]|jgi:hypothetical protein|nr:MAG: DUF3325 domain-containing protein [Sphingobium sp.]